MTAPPLEPGDDRYGPSRLSIELTDVCNLHCRYCLRDDEALHGRPAHHLSPDLLRRVLRDARDSMGITHVAFTGGEPTLHPQFAAILGMVGAERLRASFVTNGWNFERIWPSLADARGFVSHVAFSLDGVTAEAHDAWRGAGSFVRLVKAFARCQRAGVPFVVKVVLRRDTVDRLERFTMFAARLGASAVSFSHLLPTSRDIDAGAALTQDARTRAEQEIAILRRVFKMDVRIDVGYYNVDAGAPPCSPLAGRSCNVDYRGRLTLCCNLSGFRGRAPGEADVAADLNVESFPAAYDRVRRIAALQNERRSRALARFGAEGRPPDLHTGSPCLLCLHSFDKIPWRG